MVTDVLRARQCGGTMHLPTPSDSDSARAKNATTFQMPNLVIGSIRPQRLVKRSAFQLRRRPSRDATAASLFKPAHGTFIHSL
mmetsp:Transcript_30581/g.56523  ORF Transcript_30581/g.56523 Transcript_30581/m.56523 type:complete len:83 (+) Transcript_30581:78-326(+)